MCNVISITTINTNTKHQYENLQLQYQYQLLRFRLLTNRLQISIRHLTLLKSTSKLLWYIKKKNQVVHRVLKAFLFNSKSIIRGQCITPKYMQHLKFSAEIYFFTKQHILFQHYKFRTH